MLKEKLFLRDTLSSVCGEIKPKPKTARHGAFLQGQRQSLRCLLQDTEPRHIRLFSWVCPAYSSVAVVADAQKTISGVNDARQNCLVLLTCRDGIKPSRAHPDSAIVVRVKGEHFLLETIDIQQPPPVTPPQHLSSTSGLKQQTLCCKSEIESNINASFNKRIDGKHGKNIQPQQVVVVHRGACCRM